MEKRTACPVMTLELKKSVKSSAKVTDKNQKEKTEASLALGINHIKVKIAALSSLAEKINNAKAISPDVKTYVNHSREDALLKLKIHETCLHLDDAYTGLKSLIVPVLSEGVLNITGSDYSLDDGYIIAEGDFVEIWDDKCQVWLYGVMGGRELEAYRYGYEDYDLNGMYARVKNIREDK